MDCDMQTTQEKLTSRRHAGLATPSALGHDAVRNITGSLNALLADVFGLYMKTRNFHWHLSGPHFRDYHLMLDEQAGQLFSITDDIAERVRKIGGGTIRSIGHIARLQRISDNDADYVDAPDMIAELREDNRRCLRAFARHMNSAMRRRMSRRPVCWKCGSTRPSAGCGFSSKLAGRNRDLCYMMNAVRNPAMV
jgi:starvation-inducible DNA-binding protein